MEGFRRRQRAKRRWLQRKSQLNSMKSRATSNVFCMFDQSQIMELKEVFNMIDQDCDGFISKTDLLETVEALGAASEITDVDVMLAEAPSYVNLTMFLTLFGNKLNGTDPDDIFVAAFRTLDLTGSGKVHGDTLKKMLTEHGNKFSDEEVSLMLDNATLDKDGNFDYAEFVQLIKYGRTI